MKLYCKERICHSQETLVFVCLLNLQHTLIRRSPRRRFFASNSILSHTNAKPNQLQRVAAALCVLQPTSIQECKCKLQSSRETQATDHV